MIVSFKDQASKHLFYGIDSKAARKACPQNLWRIAARKLDLLDSVQFLDELRVPPGNHLEKLSGTRKEEFSIRINQQYRICFQWTDSGPDHVTITDYH